LRDSRLITRDTQCLLNEVEQCNCFSLLLSLCFILQILKIFFTFLLDFHSHYIFVAHTAFYIFKSHNSLYQERKRAKRHSKEINFVYFLFFFNVFQYFINHWLKSFFLTIFKITVTSTVCFSIKFVLNQFLQVIPYLA